MDREWLKTLKCRKLEGPLYICNLFSYLFFVIDSPLGRILSCFTFSEDSAAMRLSSREEQRAPSLLQTLPNGLSHHAAPITALC